MTGNRSLDEFLAGDETDPADDPPAPDASPGAGTSAVEAAGTDGDGPEGAGPALEDAADPATVEPLAETFVWSAAGGPCGGCGERVETRWRDGDDLVCPDCKAW